MPPTQTGPCSAKPRSTLLYGHRQAGPPTGFPTGESRANPMYWDEDTRRTWADFVSCSKSTLVREDAWWDVSEVEQRDRRVENVDWNA